MSTDLTVWVTSPLSLTEVEGKAKMNRYQVIDLVEDEVRGDFDTLQDAQRCARTIPAYAIWRRGDGPSVRVEHCDVEYSGNDDRVRQAMGLPRGTRTGWADSPGR